MVGGFPCLFRKWTKSTLIWEKIVLFVCIYGLISHLKCSFKNILEKKQENFPLELFFCMSCMSCLSKCFYSKKPVLPQKFPGCVPVTFNINFSCKFNPDIWVFADFPIYRKSIHYNISLVF